MPKFARYIPDFNARFRSSEIEKLAEELYRFAPGNPLDGALMIEEGSPIFQDFKAFIDELPATFHEAINGVLRVALATKPPTPVTFAWSPAYAPELTVLHADCGVTILLKTPYPDGEAR